MTSWSQVRGLTYSTIGRSVRGTVHSHDGSTARVWFDPPSCWRVEDDDGAPQLIETGTDEYRFDGDVVVHRTKHQNQVTMYAGTYPQRLFTTYRMWPAPESRFGHAQVDFPTEIAETEVRDRRGWRLEFQDLQGGPPIEIVVDRELGVTLRWSQGDQWLEMSEPVLDEFFDPDLFSWTGQTVDAYDHVSQAQLDHDQKMRDIAAMPTTQLGWAPVTINTSAVDGDPLSGALDVLTAATTAFFGVRRWLTGLDEPDAGHSVQNLVPRAREEIGPWTVELRSHAQLSPDDIARILAAMSLPEPPAAVDQVRADVADREAAAREAEIVEQLGAGRRLDDYLHDNGGASLLIRTDFSDDARWREVVLAATAPVESGNPEYPTFQASLLCIDSPENDSLTVDDLVARIGDGPPYYAFIADTETMTDAEMPILIIDAGPAEYHQPGATFRAIPDQMPGIENNLSLANMGFDDFARATDADGVFRGFPPAPKHVASLERDELIALSATNRSTEALVRFTQELESMDNTFAVIHEGDRATIHQNAANMEVGPETLRVGFDEYLAALADGGPCHAGHVMVLGGYWSLIIDPESGRLDAAMLVQNRSATP